MNKVVAIVQARTTSERFPMKIFASLKGRPMLAHALERAAAIHGVDQVVLAVPENDVRLVAHLWPHVVGGPEKDVLKRYALAAERYEADVIVRLTADNPLLCPHLCDETIEYFNSNAFDYVSNVYPIPTWPDGTDTEVFTLAALIAAHQIAKSKYDREHVTAWMRDNLKCGSYISMEDFSKRRWTVDTRNDISHVEQILEMSNGPMMTLKEIMAAEDLIENGWQG